MLQLSDSTVRLHHKIAFVLILLFFGYTLIAVGVSIYIFKESVVEQKKNELELQSNQFKKELEELSHNSINFLKNFLAENQLETPLEMVSKNGPLYSRTKHRDLPINKFRKAILFQYQYDFLRSMLYFFEKDGLSHLSLFLLSPFQMFPEMKPEPVIQISDKDVFLHLFEKVRNTQKTSYRASWESLKLIEKDPFLFEARRMKFTGLKQEKANSLLEESGFKKIEEENGNLLTIDPFSKYFFFEKRLENEAIIKKMVNLD